MFIWLILCPIALFSPFWYGVPSQMWHTLIGMNVLLQPNRYNPSSMLLLQSFTYGTLTVGLYPGLVSSDGCTLKRQHWIMATVLRLYDRQKVDRQVVNIAY
jgi:hypothetical protein